MKSYEDLKNELVEIAIIIEKYPDEVKKQVFELLVNKFLGERISSPPNNPQKNHILNEEISTPIEDIKTKATSKVTKKKASTESFKIDKTLDLRANSNSASFAEFYKEKAPTSTAEFNAISVYYLINLKGHPVATLNQVYTCYLEVKKKPAGHFKQSFRDTQNKHGYIELKDNGDIVIPHRGVVFVEHDLPKQNKTKK